MKTPEQLKGIVRHFAKTNNLFPQEVLQMFFFERILERLSNSQYRENFILKGGLLISSMIGITERTTMDMDTTVTGIQMEEEQIEQIIREIIEIDVGDGITFEYIRMEPIRESDAYNNFRVHLQVKYGKINSPMKIDITTGDEIVPAAIEYSYKMMFEDRKISIKAYTLETILAEKYETILSRNITTTRARDFYDLHALFRSRKDEIRQEILKLAIFKTSQKRGSLEIIKDYKEICEDLRKEDAIKRLWVNYIKENQYAADIKCIEAIDTIEKIGELIS